MVTFEVARLSAKGGHAHVQVVPIPLKLKDKVEKAFLDHGQQQGIEFEDDAEGAMQNCVDGKKSYFRVELPDGKKLVHLMRDTRSFSLQFGRSVSSFSVTSWCSWVWFRQVIVSLLAMPERLDWKACAQTDEEEKTDTQLFKTAFAVFDPSL